MFGKELGPDLLLGALVSQGLGAIFAKFVDRAMFRVGPGTRLAIDAALLIEIHQPARSANDAHFAVNVFEGVCDRVNSGRRGGRRRDF